MAQTSKPIGCTNLKLHQLSRRIARLYEADVRALGLKNTQYSLLSYLVKLGPIQPSTLAAEMQLDPSTLTRNLQPLVAQGWIEIKPGPDARSRIIVATEAGRALRAEAQRAWKRSQLTVNDLLGEQRVATLHDMIDKCLDLLDSQNSTENPGG
jgi:DNA-binding MarR family transcriptional regulator